MQNTGRHNKYTDTAIHTHRKLTIITSSHCNYRACECKNQINLGNHGFRGQPLSLPKFAESPEIASISLLSSSSLDAGLSPRYFAESTGKICRCRTNNQRVTAGKRNFRDKRSSHRSLCSSQSLSPFLQFSVPLAIPLGQILDHTEMYLRRSGVAAVAGLFLPR